MGGGNNELQAYLWKQRTSGSKEAIWSSKPTRTTPTCLERRTYSSGRIRSKLRDWTYCRVDVWAKLPIGKGMWPAIWMLPTEEKYGGWASSGEIDIMELVGHEPSTYHGTLHYGGGWPRNKHTGKKYKLASGTFADDFHVFSILWEKGQITWAIDGKPWQTQKNWFSEKALSPLLSTSAFTSCSIWRWVDGGPATRTPKPSFPPKCWLTMSGSTKRRSKGARVTLRIGAVKKM